MFQRSPLPTPVVRGPAHARGRHTMPCLSIVAAAAVAAAAPAMAQDDPLPPGEAAASASPLSVDLSLTFTHAYFFRGILQEDKAFIIQPSIELSYDLYSTDAWALSAVVGFWNSIHDSPTAPGTNDETLAKWYEADYYGGLSFSTGPWTFGTTYTLYTSPAKSFRSVHELSFTVGYDDSELLGGFALSPYATLAIELGPHAVLGDRNGTYLELGVAPSHEFKLGPVPVTLTVPATVGLSLSNYYQDAAGDNDVFGYFDIGLEAGVPIPLGFGEWTATAGVHFLFLGDTLREINAGNGSEVIFNFTISASF